LFQSSPQQATQGVPQRAEFRDAEAKVLTSSDHDDLSNAARREATSAPASCGTPRRPGVLVVDDEGCVRGVMNVWLRRQGFATWLASNGLEALALYRQHGREIAVVLDVRMPFLDGPQTLAALRQLNPHVRCCFLTGGLGQYTEGQLRDAGAVAVLEKPARLDEVAQVVRLLAAEDGPAD
jgi:CheY-like chemotaxis protein